MKTLLLSAAILVGQVQQAQHEDIVRLPPHAMGIRASDGGKMLELIYSATSISLPKQPPLRTLQGDVWYVDVKNLGPGDVAVTGDKGFTVRLQPGRVVRIRSDGTRYSVAEP